LQVFAAINSFAASGQITSPKEHDMSVLEVRRPMPPTLRTSDGDRFICRRPPHLCVGCELCRPRG
jgi:hypothetical protein